MNKFNLTKLARYGVLAEITHTAAGHPVVTLNHKATWQQFGFAGPPDPPFELDEFSSATAVRSNAELIEFKERDPSVQRAVTILNALARQTAAVGAANTDDNLAGPGRLKVAVDALSKSLTTMGAEFAGLTDIETNLSKQYDALYAVPEADTAQTLIDGELRAWFKALDARKQIEHLHRPEVDNGRLLLALKRSPVPLEDRVAEKVRDMWVNRIALANPERAATLELAQKCCEWAIGLAKRIAALATSASLSATNGAVDRFAAYKILKPTGGLAVLDFSDHEIATHERRLLQAAG